MIKEIEMPAPDRIREGLVNYEYTGETINGIP
jgi:hypothetical protein